MFIRNFVANTVFGQIMDRIYGQIIGLGLVLSDEKAPRIAGRFGPDTNTGAKHHEHGLCGPECHQHNQDRSKDGGGMTESKLVYIASPYAGDMEENVAFAKEACRYAAAQGCTPVAVHLLYPQFLDDQVPQEREAGLKMGRRVLAACDEFWLCGERLSAGMRAEKVEAERLGIPIRLIPAANIFPDTGQRKQDEQKEEVPGMGCQRKDQ